MGASTPNQPKPTTTDHRARAHIVMGGVLTGTGLALVGVVGAIIDRERDRLAQMRGMTQLAYAEGREFTGQEFNDFKEMTEDYRRGRGAAIGLSVVAAASISTGIALLVTRKRTKSLAYALRPYGGVQGVGATLRLRF